MNISESQIDVVSKLMAATATRHRVIGENIANANTPEYRSREVSFEEDLASILSEEELDTEHLDTAIQYATGLPARMDGNNVDVAREMGELEKNAIIYSAYSNILALRINMLKSSITGQ